MFNRKRLIHRVEELEAGGTTKGQIAAKAGMTPQQFWNVLKNPDYQPDNMKLGTLDKLAKAVGLDPCDLLK